MSIESPVISQPLPANGKTARDKDTHDGLRARRERRQVQSIARALDIIDVLSEAGGEMKLNEIAAAVGLNVSTCHHQLATLVERNYVGQNHRSRSYFLGNKVLELSRSRSSQLDLAELAMPELRKLNEATRETVHLEIMRGTELTSLAKLDSPEVIRVGSETVGKSNAVHATATGKSILAWLPEGEIDRVISQKGLTRFTENTITSRKDLLVNLAHVRRNGFAVDREEFHLGVICHGAAIRDHTGAVIGSVSCSMPAMRETEAHADLVRDKVRECAAILSEKLGNSGADRRFKPPDAA